MSESASEQDPQTSRDEGGLSDLQTFLGRYETERGTGAERPLMAYMAELQHLARTWLSPGTETAAGDEEVDGAWLRLVINAEGVVPPGARVVLPDGSRGVVMGPGDPMDAWRPSVLVGGRVVIPDLPVRLGAER